MGNTVIAASPLDIPVGRDAVEEWVDVSEDELPARFGDACKMFRVVCSNGFTGPLSLESAFLHKPTRYPQCFPSGEDGSACCTTRIQRLKTPNASFSRGPSGPSAGSDS